MARAERLYEENLADREQLQGMMIEFRTVIETQDERRSARVREQFAAALDALERA